MSHPAIDPVAIARLRTRLGAVASAVPDTTAAVPAGRPRPSARRVSESARRLTRSVAGPVLERVTARVAVRVGADIAALRADVEELRRELVRTRDGFEAELALVRAELATVPRGER